jgi:hypothetical protein
MQKECKVGTGNDFVIFDSVKRPLNAKRAMERLCGNALAGKMNPIAFLQAFDNALYSC